MYGANLCDLCRGMQAEASALFKKKNILNTKAAKSKAKAGIRHFA
jgi:hypothetical protein